MCMIYWMWLNELMLGFIYVFPQFCFGVFCILRLGLFWLCDGCVLVVLIVFNTLSFLCVITHSTVNFCFLRLLSHCRQKRLKSDFFFLPICNLYWIFLDESLNLTNINIYLSLTQAFFICGTKSDTHPVFIFQFNLILSSHVGFNLNFISVR